MIRTTLQLHLRLTAEVAVSSSRDAAQAQRQHLRAFAAIALLSPQDLLGDRSAQGPKRGSPRASTALGSPYQFLVASDLAYLVASSACAEGLGHGLGHEGVRLLQSLEA